MLLETMYALVNPKNEICVYTDTLAFRFKDCRDKVNDKFSRYGGYGWAKKYGWRIKKVEIHSHVSIF